MPVTSTFAKIEIPLLSLLLLLSFGFFLAGIITPIMTITKLIFLETSFSILSGLNDLLVQREYFLFIIIGSLSVALPLFKMALLALALCNNRPTKNLSKAIDIIHNFGRWAMLDVLVVALLFVTVKLGAIASVEVHYGLYLFAVSVLITMWVTHRTVVILREK